MLRGLTIKARRPSIREDNNPSRRKWLTVALNEAPERRISLFKSRATSSSSERLTAIHVRSILAKRIKGEDRCAIGKHIRVRAGAAERGCAQIASNAKSAI